MKRRNATIWLFLCTVVVLWLALGLTSLSPRTDRNEWEKELTTQGLTGVTAVEIQGLAGQELGYRRSEVKIEFSAANDQAIAHIAGDTQSATAQDLFERKGNTLVVRLAPPPPRMSSKNQTGWWVQKVVLPRSITHIYSPASPVSISSTVDLATLNVDGTNVEVEASHVGALNITSHTRAICDHPCKPTAFTPSAVNVKGKNIPSVTIAIAGGSVRLEGTEKMQQLHLRTTADTRIDLDRIDTFKRMDWQILSSSREAELSKPLAPCPPKAPASTPEAAARAASEAAEQKAQCAAEAAEDAAQAATAAQPDTSP